MKKLKETGPRRSLGSQKKNGKVTSGVFVALKRKERCRNGVECLPQKLEGWSDMSRAIVCCVRRSICPIKHLYFSISTLDTYVASPFVHVDQLQRRSLSSSSSQKSQFPRFGLNEFRLTKEGMSPEHTGTSWSASHLRRKSFDDLHALWLVLYKERNALLTHQTKVSRVRDPTQTRVTTEKMYKVKKSMARIKAVLAERRKAYKASREDTQDDE
jgi:ribosomal protein L29